MRRGPALGQNATMARSKSYYGVYKDNGRTATGSGPLRHIQALAQAISTPGLGVGRTVCIAFHSGAPTGWRQGLTGECYVKGRKTRGASLAGARRRRR